MSRFKSSHAHTTDNVWLTYLFIFVHFKEFFWIRRHSWIAISSKIPKLVLAIFVFLIFLYVSENKSNLNYKSTKIPLPVKVCEHFPSVSSLLVIGEDEGGRSNFSSINNKNKTKTIEMSSLRQTPLTCSGHTRPVVFLAFSSINEEGHYFSISACKGRFLYLIIIVNI